GQGVVVEQLVDRRLHVARRGTLVDHVDDLVVLQLEGRHRAVGGVGRGGAGRGGEGGDEDERGEDLAKHWAGLAWVWCGRGGPRRTWGLRRRARKSYSGFALD